MFRKPKDMSQYEYNTLKSLIIKGERLRKYLGIIPHGYNPGITAFSPDGKHCMYLGWMMDVMDEFLKKQFPECQDDNTVLKWYDERNKELTKEKKIEHQRKK